MYFKTFVSVAAVVAATCLPFGVHAQEVHTLTPQFPDAFKVRTTTTTDVQITMPDQTGGSRTQSVHSSMAWTDDTRKTADGYHATVAIDSVNMTAPNLPITVTATPGSTTTTSSTTTGSTPTTTASSTTTTNSTTITGPSMTLGTPTPASPTPGLSPADMQQKVTALLKLVGNAEVSYDSRMRPVRIDNLETLKTNIKNMILVAVPSQNADQVTSIFDLFLKDITPESAASFLRQSPRARLPYGMALPLKTAVPLDPATAELYGASLTVGGTATLDSWEEGKAAHLTMMIQPTQADMHAFAGDLTNAFLDKVFIAMGANLKPEDKIQARAMVSRLLDNSMILVSSSCRVDVNLNNTALNHMDCDTNFFFQIDPSKLMTDAQLKANPAAAAKLKTVAVAEIVHTVADTTLDN